MFIHFGLYAAHGRHEWAMENEAIPVTEYQQLHRRLQSRARLARATGRKLAKAAGMKYMVLTTKHHEGFCNWDTKLTNYNAPPSKAPAATSSANMSRPPAPKACASASITR